MEEKKKSPEKKPYAKPELIELGSKETANCTAGTSDALGCTNGLSAMVSCASGSTPII
jgi:hypothetical protein